MSKALTQQEEENVEESQTFVEEGKQTLLSLSCSDDTFFLDSMLEKSSLRRKRQLYNTVTDLELISDSDAEGKQATSVKKPKAPLAESQDNELELVSNTQNSLDEVKK